MRYGKPASEPPSPSASRSSTPHHLSDNDDDDDSDSDEDQELKRIGSASSEKSFVLERPKSTENLFKNMNINKN